MGGGGNDRIYIKLTPIYIAGYSRINIFILAVSISISVIYKCIIVLRTFCLGRNLGGKTFFPVVQLITLSLST